MAEQIQEPETDTKKRLISDVGFELYGDVMKLRSDYMTETKDFISISDYVKSKIIIPYVQAARAEGLLP